MQLVDKTLLNRLCRQASQSPRLRTHHNLHQSYQEPVQRLLIAMQLGSYVRPHYHPEANKWELFVVLQGRLAFYTFDPQGRLQQRLELAPQSPLCGLELPQGYWHCTQVLEPNTVFLEIKQGPYLVSNDKHFASWSPAENSPDVPLFLQQLETLAPGEQLTE